MVPLLGVAHGDCELTHGGRWEAKSRSGAQLESWTIPVVECQSAIQSGQQGANRRIWERCPQEMAEYQEMRPTGYSMLGHAPVPNPKSAAEHESSPQNRAQTGMRENAGHRKTAEYQEMQPIGHPVAGHTPDPKPKSRLKHGSSPARPADTGVQNRNEWRNTNRLSPPAIPRQDMYQD